MSPGHKIGYQMLGRQIFCAEMMHSTAGFSLCLFPTMNILTCSKATTRLRSTCPPALLKCQSKPVVFTLTIILVIDLRSISFNHLCLITLTLISQRPCAVVWLMRKSHFWCHVLIKHTVMC